MSNKVKISIPDVKQDLANGLTRKEIGQKYGLNFTNTKALFQHPELKGLKTKKPFDPAFEIVGEETAQVAEAVATTVEEAPVEEVAEETTTQKGVW